MVSSDFCHLYSGICHLCLYLDNHTMCGIFGVHNVPDAASCVHLGLYSLQHRGQESSGIVTVDDRGVARALRAMGLVSEGMNGSLSDLPGDTGIGHTRYSTAGSSTIENA